VERCILTTPSNIVVHEKLTVAQPVEEFSAGPTCSKVSANGPWPEKDESSPHSLALFI
jgi:hypothetical protein